MSEAQQILLLLLLQLPYRNIFPMSEEQLQALHIFLINTFEECVQFGEGSDGEIRWWYWWLNEREIIRPAVSLFV